MSDTKGRLETCFAVVFPEMAMADLSSLSAEACEAWDSLATVTLVAVVEEEFALRIPPDEGAKLLSFEAFEEYLRRAPAGSG